MIPSVPSSTIRSMGTFSEGQGVKKSVRNHSLRFGRLSAPLFGPGLAQGFQQATVGFHRRRKWLRGRGTRGVDCRPRSRPFFFRDNPFPRKGVWLLFFSWRRAGAQKKARAPLKASKKQKPPGGKE